MNSNNLTGISSNVLPYWNKIKNLGSKDKIELIALISASLTNDTKATTSNRTKEMISRCSGSWKGNMTSKEIIDIINTKVSSSEPVKF